MDEHYSTHGLKNGLFYINCRCVRQMNAIVTLSGPCSTDLWHIEHSQINVPDEISYICQDQKAVMSHISPKISIMLSFA